MEFVGKLNEIKKVNNDSIISFEVENDNIPNLEKLFSQPELKISVSKPSVKRSLDANAYMWVLCQKMAEILETTKDEIYRIMLNKYGPFTTMFVKRDLVNKIGSLWKAYDIIGTMKKNGEEYVQIRCYYGSHEFDSVQMSHFINNLQNEAIELGIDVLPQKELEKIVSTNKVT